MGWVFGHIYMCHLLLLKHQPIVVFLFLALLFTALVVFSFSLYEPNEKEKVVFLFFYTIFAITLHPFTADVIMSWWAAMFLFVYGTKEEDCSYNNTEEDAICLCDTLPKATKAGEPDEQKPRTDSQTGQSECLSTTQGVADL